MSNNNINFESITIYIESAMRDRAFALAEHQSTPDRVLQVYGNALAVQATNTYLGWLNFPTDLEVCESLNPVMAGLGDFADLYLPGVGRLECRLVPAGATMVALPVAAVTDRIGCVVWQMAESWEEMEEAQELKVLGFTARLAASIALADLESTEVLIDRLQSLITTDPSAELLPISLDALLRPVQEYVKDLSIEQIKAELERIYSTSDDLYFEYRIGQFFKDGQERAGKVREPELGLVREQSVNKDRDLQALAAELAEQLQELWGRLD